MTLWRFLSAQAWWQWILDAVVVVPLLFAVVVLAGTCVVLFRDSRSRK